ncbi:MAG: ribosomal small subunit pseudouridine synthase [Anaerocolumna sp.]|jgi:16S rRNA pseudouridine516 synthase|nr:ribosomal small subunit pseudouridine synthase [Anaerocolumna sp.]
MSESVRLDKYLADVGIGTRSEVKNYIRKGRVQVDGVIVKESDMKINTKTSSVLFDNTRVAYETYEYFMLNKPAGVVSATRDNVNTTVVELIREGTCKGDDSEVESFVIKDLFPVGRLDKDTEGLLLITNDGDLAHRLLSPKKHVAKIYFAQIKGKVTMDDVRVFKEGIELSEDFTTLPAELKIIESDEALESDELSEVEVTIFEGKFHQVKRMFEAVEKEVIYLKRLSMGELVLDKDLNPGEFRRLTPEELSKIKGTK